MNFPVDQVVDIFKGECRNITDPPIEVTSGQFLWRGIRKLILFLHWSGITKTVLFAPNPNISLCKKIWWLGIPIDVVKEHFDAIAVFYDDRYSMTVGATAACDGNQNKPDYRRITYARDLKPFDNNRCWEFFCKLNEENVRRLFSDEPLEVFQRQLSNTRNSRC